MNKLLLACDLDRTVIPDGVENLSTQAKELFQKFIDRSEVSLAYISGRSFSSFQKAQQDYGIPQPNFYVGDVGTSLYVQGDNGFELYAPWLEVIGSDWGERNTREIHDVLQGLPYLRLQEDWNQNTYKLSYYIPGDIDENEVKKDIYERVLPLNIKIVVVTSIDESRRYGYLDVLPASATKGDALAFIVNQFQFSKGSVVFAGDSGNDTGPILQGFKTIIVNNALSSFKEQVKQLINERNIGDIVYFAHGGYEGMNGNYMAGILEGLHFFHFLD